VANSLLDFVISLVRNPDAAARYAANPAKAIADAHLTGVTSVDVSNLMPMVSDSLSMGGPVGASSAAPVAEHGNVWASGAAAAALDSFAPHPPAPVVHHATSSGVINAPVAPSLGAAPTPPGPIVNDPHSPSVLLAGAATPEAPNDHGIYPADDPGAWDHSTVHPHPAGPDHHGFGVHG
jgi:hypothetical protein